MAVQASVLWEAVLGSRRSVTCCGLPCRQLLCTLGLKRIKRRGLRRCLGRAKTGQREARRLLL